MPDDSEILPPNVIPLADGRAPRFSKRQAEVCALRMQGLTYRQIAEALDITMNAVEKHLYEARKRARLRDVPDLLDHVALPIAADNLIEGLRNGNEKFTIETLKGLGAFSAHRKQDTTVNANAGMTLTLKVEMPDGAELREPETLIGEVVGVPLLLDET